MVLRNLEDPISGQRRIAIDESGNYRLHHWRSCGQPKVYDIDVRLLTSFLFPPSCLPVCTTRFLLPGIRRPLGTVTSSLSITQKAYQVSGPAERKRTDDRTSTSELSKRAAFHVPDSHKQYRRPHSSTQTS